MSLPTIQTRYLFFTGKGGVGKHHCPVLPAWL